MLSYFTSSDLNWGTGGSTSSQLVPPCGLKLVVMAKSVFHILKTSINTTEVIKGLLFNKYEILYPCCGDMDFTHTCML